MRWLGSCLLAGVLITDSEAQNWHSPHPWRADAVLEGRTHDYNNEYFLHAFSYRHLIDHPSPLEEGIRGTAGSLTSDRLYMDFRYRQSFVFDNPDQAFTLDIQRAEDFDGSYDRQLVGFRQTLAKRWQLSLQGDVFSDKSLTDIYFGARRLHGEGSWLQLSVVLPNAYFNDKTDSQSELVDEPRTLFAQWHQQHSDRASTTLSVNHTPDATLDDRTRGDRVSSQQTRVALRHRAQQGDWQWQADLNGERTRRQHQLDESIAPRAFRRDMASLTLAVRYWPHRWQPQVGARYFWLDEDGWFGRELNGNGEVSRQEPMLFGGISLPLSDTQRLAPTVYLSRPRVEQNVSANSQQWRDRDDDEFVGKLSVPWHITVSKQNGAVLSVVPSMRLHRFAFGGGNVQLHWPL